MFLRLFQPISEIIIQHLLTVVYTPTTGRNHPIKTFSIDLNSNNHLNIIVSLLNNINNNSLLNNFVFNFFTTKINSIDINNYVHNLNNDLMVIFISKLSSIKYINTNYINIYFTFKVNGVEFSSYYLYKINVHTLMFNMHKTQLLFDFNSYITKLPYDIF